MIICALAVLLWAPSIMRLFTSESDLIRLGSLFLRIATAGYLMNGIITSLQNSISGSGDTLPPMIISILSTWTIMLPGAFILPRVTDLGVFAIRWAMVISVTCGALVYLAYFRLGRWKSKII
jgi:Na+-driven multidrug efflux pump